MVSAAEIAREIGNTGELKRKSTVAAFVDLPGVPEGTAGKVSLVNGFDKWIRYRVLFQNGVDLGAINRAELVPVKQYATLAAKREDAIESGAFDRVEAASDGNGAEAAAGEAAAGGDDAVVNGVSIPGHLLARSASARERLSA